VARILIVFRHQTKINRFQLTGSKLLSMEAMFARRMVPS
jgi:hypothetical protein